MHPDSAVWAPSIISRITCTFSSNEKACLRLVSKAANEAFREHSTIKLSQPVPVWAFEEHWLKRGGCEGLTRVQRRQLVSLTAASNIVPNLEMALVATGLPPCEADLRAAAGAGALDSCRWLVEPGRLVGAVSWEDVLITALRAGQEVACDWCVQFDPSLQSSECWRIYWAREAAQGGHVTLVDKLLAAAVATAAAAEGVVFADPDDSAGLFLAALRGCDLATAQRVCELAGGPRTWDDVDDFVLDSPITAALGSQTPDWQAKAEWLLTQGFRPLPCSYIGPSCLTSETSVLERFAWLKAQGCALQPDDEWALAPFVRAGHAAVLEWLLAEGLRPVPGDLDPDLHLGSLLAAQEGHLAALQMLARLPWGPQLSNTLILQWAAAAGRMEVLRCAWEAFRWVWDAACARTPGLLTWAARSGSVEAIRWVHSHGGGVVGQEAAWSGAVESGCQAAVEVLAELGCPLPSDGSPYARALELREWALLPLLHAQGVPMGGWAQERPLLARALEAGAAPAALLQGLAGEG